MKKYQFEEITAALSIIICLLSYQFDIKWLLYIFIAKATFDTLTAIKFAFKSAVKSKTKKKFKDEQIN